MTEQERIIADFMSVFYLLRERMQELTSDNDRLRKELQQAEEKASSLKGQLENAVTDYNMLKMAKMIEITDGDLSNARSKVNKLLREVNKCINLLSEK